METFMKSVFLNTDQNHNFFFLKKDARKEFINTLFDIGVYGKMFELAKSELNVENNKKKNTLGGGTVTKSIESASRRAAASEIDLRGMDVEQALLEMDRFLDECVILNLKTVSIIHGKGTGALRAAVHQALKKNKAVRSFRLGVYGEGENGVTIVELK